MLTWYVYLLHLFNKSGVGSTSHRRLFSGIAVFTLILGLLTTNYVPIESHPYSLFSVPIVARLILCVCELLLIENLYLNLPEATRWHIAIPCMLLGSLACFDTLIAADTVLFRQASPPLYNARLLAMVIIAPLLVIAATRGQRWSEPLKLSRKAVFHSATLVLSGAVLLALALAGELFRRLDATWGWVAELTLVFVGLTGLALSISSRSARSVIYQTVVHHFFADRYDYRSQWLECIETLSGTNNLERTNLPTRAIRAVADVVNSPSGAIFLRENVKTEFAWAGSWNMPSYPNLPLSNPLVEKLVKGEQVVALASLQLEDREFQSLEALGPIWLAVPLLHSIGILGIIIVGNPRVRFQLDQEVFDLLRIVGREIATHIAEQRATELILQTRSLHDYGKRFSFVAHDIKNVSSQLALLLSNAEIHLDNPEFQQDMVSTVRASVTKIDALLKRLDQPSPARASTALTPLPHLIMLISAYQQARGVQVALDHDGSTGKVAMGPEAFDAAVTHLLNNAVEAAPTETVRIHVGHEAERILIDIVDKGSGMSPSFVRERLFAPFMTSKTDGSGIGAFQARELVREAGGDIEVITQQGHGTTMRIVMRRIDISSGPSAAPESAITVGGIGG